MRELPPTDRILVLEIRSKTSQGGHERPRGGGVSALGQTCCLTFDVRLSLTLSVIIFSFISKKYCKTGVLMKSWCLTFDPEKLEV
jgi:hypothetical protein